MPIFAALNAASIRLIARWATNIQLSTQQRVLKASIAASRRRCPFYSLALSFSLSPRRQSATMYSPFRLIGILAPLCLIGCASNPAIIYRFQSSTTPDSDVALVQVQRGSSGPVVMLARVDGTDPLKHSAMESYKPQGLERYEPRIISISPGDHTFVVQFQLMDPFAELFTDEITSESAKKYPVPDHTKEFGRPDFVTLMHTEQLAFNAVRGGRYIFKYRWDKNAREIYLHVEQCSTDWAACSPYQFTTSSSNTKFILGMARGAQ